MRVDGMRDTLVPSCRRSPDALTGTQQTSAQKGKGARHDSIVRPDPADRVLARLRSVTFVTNGKASTIALCGSTRPQLLTKVEEK